MERGTQVGSTELVPRHGIILLQQRGSRFYESQVIWINIRKRTVYVHFYIINMPLVHVTRPPYDVIIFETCNISEAELKIITQPFYRINRDNHLFKEIQFVIGEPFV